MAWDFPKDRRFDMQVDGFSTFNGCWWIEQELRLCDIRAIYRPAPVEETEAPTPTLTAAGVE